MTASKFHEYLTILLCGLSIPLSMFMSLRNVAFSFVTNAQQNDGFIDTYVIPNRITIYECFR